MMDVSLGLLGEEQGHETISASLAQQVPMLLGLKIKIRQIKR